MTKPPATPEIITLMDKNSLDLPLGYDPKKRDDPIVTFQERNSEIIITFIFPSVTLTSLEFTPNRDIFKNRIFRHVKISNVGYMTESGKALLPSLGRFVQIPHGYYVKTKRVTKSKPKPIYKDGRNIYILTSQEELTETSNKERHFEYSEKFYRSSYWYPSAPNIVKLTGPFDIDGYNAYLLHVRPLQYKPDTRHLIGYSKIVVTLEIKKIEEPLRNCPHLNFDQFKDAYGNFFINSNREEVEKRFNVDEACSNESVENLPKASDKRDSEFLIIYHPEFEKAASQLMDWKNSINLRTEKVSTKETGRTINSLKNYIRSRRNPKNPDADLCLPLLRYVLLMGDINYIETEYIRFEGYEKYPTDYYLSTPCDASRIRGHNCVFPWLAIGRIPVSTLPEALAIVEKIKRFEMNILEEKVKKEVTLVASFQDTDIGLDNPVPNKVACRQYIRTMEQIRETISERCDINTIYVEQNVSNEYLQHFFITKKEFEDYRNTHHRFLEGLNVDYRKVKFKDEKEARIELLMKIFAGQMIIAHRGHSSFDGWGNPDIVRGHLLNFEKELNIEIDKLASEKNKEYKLELKEIKNIKEKDKKDEKGLSVFFSTNCSSGRFEKSSVRKSFAEELLCIKDFGAVSVIAATDRSRTWRNDSFIKALFDGLWCVVLPPYSSVDKMIEEKPVCKPVKYSRLGDIMNYAKAYLLIKHDGVNVGNKTHFEIFHILGDPTLQLLKTD